jgi:hypothetical protein
VICVVRALLMLIVTDSPLPAQRSNHRPGR